RVPGDTPLTIPPPRPKPAAFPEKAPTIMAKIKVSTPAVALDGDEMTRISWQHIKDKLITPFLDVELLYFDLGMEYRDQTNDQVTVDAANPIKKVGVGVKCATITPAAHWVKQIALQKESTDPKRTLGNHVDD